VDNKLDIYIFITRKIQLCLIKKLCVNIIKSSDSHRNIVLRCGHDFSVATDLQLGDIGYR
jgi:hypothetical protein